MATIGAAMTTPNESMAGSSELGAGVRCGEVLGNTYRLVQRIGTGGMGEVYAAEHLRLGRRFAVKVLHPNHAQKALTRFRREAKAIARIENEFVIGVVDCGEAADGAPYLVMDLLHGEDLRALLERAAPLPVSRAVKLICDAAQGVIAVHAAGLVHRDLKPENLFVSKRATGEDWCKVLDFGVAKMETSEATTEGAIIGTVRYMAPEQLEDGASAGSAVDVYALGAILYECLTGRPPHSGTTTHELMFKIMNERPLAVDALRAEIPRRLAEAVARALAKAPSDRFRSAQEFADAVAPFTRGVRGAKESLSDATVDLERGFLGIDETRRPPTDGSLSRVPWLIAAVAVVSSCATSWWAIHIGRPMPSSVQAVPLPSVATVAADLPGTPPVSTAAPVPPSMSAEPITVSKPKYPVVKRPVPMARGPEAAFDVDNPYANH